MVQVGGLATGLDVNSIVTQLVGAEISPAQFRLDKQEADYQAEISSLGTLKAALNEFKTALEDLDTLEDLRPRTATSSNETLFTVSASDSAVEGVYDIQVDRLAQEHQLMSGTFASPGAAVGTGTLTFTRGGDSFSVTVGSSAQTLEDIRDAINSAADNPGIKATIVNVDDGSGGLNSHLVLSAGAVGQSNAISITAVDDDGNNTDDGGLSALIYPPGTGTNVMTEQRQALDSQISLFGQTLTSSTNTVTDAITGVTIELLADTSPSGSSGTVSIALNKGETTSRINAFVQAYNSLAESLDTLGGYDAATEQGGTLLGDATLRSASSSLRRELSTAVSESGLSLRTLAEIGITTQRNGQLAVDSDDLETALASNFDDVAQLFASESGYAKRLTDVLEGLVGTDGSIDSRIEGINALLSDIGDERVDLEARAATLEERYINQFTALDLLVAELNTVSSFLTQNLGNLPGFARNQS